ncbi:uncharacterized protein LOC111638968 [Centruroides sculpturatus]|uniref:uncharacterized protein LOC111638968 n=1 Tax=Centruroides sculpturatus TaxID=218467 RepID=UPI000C6ECE5D|nr:uncharacterized protein LOC111638968 [Centruroides sculpturatus]
MAAICVNIEIQSSYTRALVCTVYLYLCFQYEIALWLWCFIVAILIGIAIIGRFNAISNQLQRATANWPKSQIDNLIAKHVELCDYIHQFNSKWNEYIMLLYGIIIYLAAILTYNAIFTELPSYFHAIMFIAATFCMFLLVIGAFACSRFFASAYDSFQEVRRLGAASRRLHDKLKLLDFMKKFRENKIGISCGGCFILSKESPVQVYNNFYTMYNMLLSIRDILTNTKRNCTLLTAQSSTVNYTA